VSKIDDLCRNYERFVSLPWPDHLAGAQRIWFAVYDRADERRLRARLGEFQIATSRGGHTWRLCDLTDIFADWMTDQEYCESYFEDPDALESAMSDFLEFAAGRVLAELKSSDSGTVVAVLGAATLFGFVRVSALMDAVKDAIAGRLLVFFPGEYEANNYRLLDARDGWNYLATPITATERSWGT
jgi:hypothetical protein